MSRYSGKCDMCDHVEIFGVDKTLQSKIYLGWNIIPLAIKSEKDLIPYYPYLISVAGYENGVGTIRLTTRSFVDIEESERLESYQKEALKYFYRCKKRKEPVDYTHYDHMWDGYNADIKNEILKRVANKDMNLSDLHLPMHEYYRNELYSAMVEAGWDELSAKHWCYGWRDEYPNEKKENKA